MKMVLGILGMMVFVGSAQAGVFEPDLVCHGDNGEVLTIDHTQTRTQLIYVNVALSKNDVVQNFSGTKINGESSYQMEGLSGEKVSLAVTTVFDHGGLCGRCAPSNDIETYAKLTVGLEEKNFSCN
jgi:hypothetical protein